MKINFTKMHGCGNDFVIIDGRDSRLKLNKEQRIFIADRHRGVGCDQLIILRNADTNTDADVRMRIYNSDGNAVGACGNATRCVAVMLSEESNETNFKIQAGGRTLNCTKDDHSNKFWVNMGTASMSKITKKLHDEKYKETLGVRFLRTSVFDVAAIRIGNPHCIFLVDNIEKINLEKYGPKIEHNELFPKRTNVEFVSQSNRKGDKFRMRVWERGVGVTLACGTGAAATAWWLNKLEYFDKYCSIEADGGTIDAEVNEDGEVLITGDTESVFKSAISL